MDRRTAIAGLMALVAAPAGAKLAPPDTEVKASPIRWPSDDGTMLHGFMAIPVHASGKQPSVLVLAPRSGAAKSDLELTAAVAQAGLIACAPDPAMIVAAMGESPRAFDDLTATIGWLGRNAYATGRVGLLGTAGTERVIGQLSTRPGVAATVLLGAPPALTDQGTPPPILALPAADSAAWAAAWPRAMAYLKEHLQ